MPKKIVKPPRADAGAFVERVARMPRNGDPLPGGRRFEYDADDAMEALGSLIHQARSLVDVGLPQVDRRMVKSGLRLLFGVDAAGAHFPRYTIILDNEDRTADRYSVVFTRGSRWMNAGEICVLGMSSAPFHPQGVGLSSAVPVSKAPSSWKHLGTRIGFYDLPTDCQVLVLSHYLEAWRIPFEIVQAACFAGNLYRRAVGLAAAALKSNEYWVGDAELSPAWFEAAAAGVGKRYPDGR